MARLRIKLINSEMFSRGSASILELLLATTDPSYSFCLSLMFVMTFATLLLEILKKFPAFATEVWVPTICPLSNITMLTVRLTIIYRC